MKPTRLENLLPFIAALLVLAPPSFAGVTAFSDEPTFQATLTDWQVESFESEPAGFSIVSLSVGTLRTPWTVTSTARENEVIDTTDGHGAIAHDGSKFWKLRAGVTRIDFGGELVSAFGFHYSDLEGADIRITLHGDTDQEYVLDDRNPNETDFLGLLSDERFSAASLEWVHSQGDGVGFDRVMTGRAVPEPGSMLMGVAGLAMIVRRRT